MRTLFILFRKELGHFFKSPFGWVTVVFVLLMQGMCFSSALSSYQKAPTSSNLFAIEFNNPLFLYFFVFQFPLITMKLFAEEERIGTREPLMTAPVRTWQVLLGKYLAVYVYYIFLWLPLLLHVQIFEMVSGSPAPITWNEIGASYIFLWITGALFCAIGCLASALTSSQIIAGIVSTASITFFILLGYITVHWGDQFIAAKLINYLSFLIHKGRFINGVIDIRTITLYLSLTLFTLTITHHAIDFRRWKN